MDGIEFGQIEFREPESQLRPDRNRNFSTVACGTIDSNQLPIFVDLDVMRDMEGHARTNTQVELGGVLLGGKFIDQDGRPFVVVKEALRAEHYEATRGSFKFTHETWEQITREREQFPEDLHLVGWYHTHPNWGVFLSGMDTFICDHFFNDDLDVDLVIDPCQGDRGWFFWDRSSGTRQKSRLDAFYLYANRYRRSELLLFAKAMSVVDPTYYDPRYENPMGETAMQPVVNIHDQKSSVLQLAVLGMLTIQVLGLGLIAWRALAPPSPSESFALQQTNKSYEELLEQLVPEPLEAKEVMKKLAKLNTQNGELRTNLKGLGALVSQLENENKQLLQGLNRERQDKRQLQNQVMDLKTERDDLKTAKKSDSKEGGAFSSQNWPVLTGVGVVVVILGF
ncbi:MAG: Mov34/MPN/PAD-1 family protein [Pirellulaceae bacterium]|nr:Mov34/MPN/PAD-1 family protein [Pirellulaceae bacterium]